MGWRKTKTVSVTGAPALLTARERSTQRKSRKELETHALLSCLTVPKVKTSALRQWRKTKTVSVTGAPALLTARERSTQRKSRKELETHALLTPLSVPRATTSALLMSTDHSGIDCLELVLSPNFPCMGNSLLPSVSLCLSTMLAATCTTTASAQRRRNLSR